MGEPAASRLRVRGQPAAASAVLSLLRSGRAQSILLVGASGLGKTTLALDLAAAALCTAEPAERPCRACRACRMLESGNHPDLHRLGPDGAGGQVRIGRREGAEPNTVRRLVADLALLPVEAGARVAIVEHADRMNEDAQSALLKTLEEPPAGTILILCADEEERLLPTVRSRCARVRLGPLGIRAIEALLTELGAADAPTAARLGRLADGRPGVALAWAAAPDAVAARAEIARSLIDLVDAGRAARLAAARGLLARATEALDALARSGAGGQEVAGPPRAASATGDREEPSGADGTPDPGEPPPAEPVAGRRAPAAQRRRAALLVVEVWRGVARDLSLVQLGAPERVREPGLLDDLGSAAAHLAPGAAAAFLARLDRAGELLEANAGPELVVDALVLAWPRRVAA